jgi:hypothetical protein
MADPRVLVANGLVAALAAPAGLAFRRACRDVAGVQARVLRAIVRRNAGSDLGRRYGFASIGSVAEYRERVPLSEYEDYRPAVARIAAGQPGVLTADRVRLLEPTSGSTADPKLIPYTDSLRADFQRALLPWLADLYRHDPGLLAGTAYWSASPIARRETRTAGGVRVGFDDDAEYLGRLRRRLVGAALAVPGEVRRIDDVERFRYATLAWLVRRADLALVSVWHPSFLALLLERLPDWGERLARAVPDPARGAVVRQACRAASAAERHARLWPRLRLVSCWADGAAGLYARQLAGLLPGVRIQGKGLLATEGVVSIPLTGYASAALAARSHFFEFVPEGGGAPRLAHELTAGQRYTIVLTTSGGLYRYRLGDVVEVAGHVESCPLLSFVGREGFVSDRFGEKLHEPFVREALDRLLAQQGIDARFAMLACEGDGVPAVYTLYVEAPGTSDDALARLGVALEAALGASYHYRYCRDLGQLAPVAVFRAAAGAAEAYIARREGGGERRGAVKPVALAPDGGWRTVFDCRPLASERLTVPVLF